MDHGNQITADTFGVNVKYKKLYLEGKKEGGGGPLRKKGIFFNVFFYL